MAFDYRQFLAENKLTKVSKGHETGKAQILSEGIQIREGFNTEMDDLEECGDLDMMEANKQKEDYLKRQERAAKGNWKGSIGAFVEEHGEELGNMVSKNRQQLKDYVENVMKPELTDEAKEKVDELLDNKKSTFGFIQSLYNFTLKGSGMGLHEAEDMETYDDTMEEGMSLKENYGVEDTLRMLYNHYAAGNNGAVVTITMCGEDCDDMGQAGFAKVNVDGEEVATEQFISDEEWGYTTLNEAIEQKTKDFEAAKGTRTKKKGWSGKKSGGDQDKMAKSEMTGEKMDVTIGGVTKSISKREWSKYRKMTDPEEKKAWKQKHGFMK